jgi:hypothetical protein
MMGSVSFLAVVGVLPTYKIGFCKLTRLNVGVMDVKIDQRRLIVLTLQVLVSLNPIYN